MLTIAGSMCLWILYVDSVRPPREQGGGYQFVRAEVVSQGASMFVVLTDADCAPPPLRIDNYSPVSIMFHQVTNRNLDRGIISTF